MGSKKGLKNGDLKIHFSQVITYFSWINCAVDAATAQQKEPVVINCDETAIAFSYTGRKGNVVKTQRGGDNAAFERTRLGDKRGTITYLAFISGTPGVQHRLPQILLGNTHRFTVAALRDIAAEKPDNIHLWRDKSAWMNHMKFKRALRLLNEALTPRDTQQLILVVDCARCHLRPEVVSYAARLKIWIVVVPGRLTFLLQPLDVYAFAPFKKALVDAYYKARMRAGGMVLSATAWLRVLVTTIAGVFQHTDWAHAFARVGLTDDQCRLRKAIQQWLQADTVLLFPRGQPTEEEVAYLGGPGFCMPYTQLMKPLRMHDAHDAPPQFDVHAPPISSRTRSMSASSLPAAASASSSSRAPGAEWKTPTAVKMRRAKSLEKLEQKNPAPQPPLPPPAEPPENTPPSQCPHPGVMTRAMKKKAEQTSEPKKNAKTQ